jgi:hypothetical protein
MAMSEDVERRIVSDRVYAGETHAAVQSETLQTKLDVVTQPDIESEALRDVPIIDGGAN